MDWAADETETRTSTPASVKFPEDIQLRPSASRADSQSRAIHRRVKSLSDPVSDSSRHDNVSYSYNFCDDVLKRIVSLGCSFRRIPLIKRTDLHMHDPKPFRYKFFFCDIPMYTTLFL